mmetsp:Transcript_106371/g.297825  ORF Transcript_106371/g.297825 Transcript_106371/m.297825 type:complete len:309 (+) Transcript_106371:665-1591(+)
MVALGERRGCRGKRAVRARCLPVVEAAGGRPARVDAPAPGGAGAPQTAGPRRPRLRGRPSLPARRRGRRGPGPPRGAHAPDRQGPARGPPAAAAAGVAPTRERPALEVSSAAIRHRRGAARSCRSARSCPPTRLQRRPVSPGHSSRAPRRPRHHRPGQRPAARGPLAPEAAGPRWEARGPRARRRPWRHPRRLGLEAKPALEEVEKKMARPHAGPLRHLPDVHPGGLHRARRKGLRGQHLQRRQRGFAGEVLLRPGRAEKGLRDEDGEAVHGLRRRGPEGGLDDEHRADIGVHRMSRQAQLTFDSPPS